MKKSKTITLLKGEEGGYWWTISCRVSDIGRVKEIGTIRYRNEKYDEDIIKYRQHNKELIKNYNAEYRKSHPQNWKNWPSSKNRYLKELILGLYYEDGNSFILKQGISREGEVSGIGFFSMLRSSAERARQYRIHNFKNLILLNDYFSNSELHHLNDEYGVYIPKDLHRSVFHNMKTGKNMKVINRKALRYLDLNTDTNKKANCFK